MLMYSRSATTCSNSGEPVFMTDPATQETAATAAPTRRPVTGPASETMIDRAGDSASP